MRSFALLLAFALASCDSVEPAASGVGDLVLTVEVPPPGRPPSGLILHVETVEEYSCLRQPLEVVYRQGAERLSARVAGVSEPAGCFTAVSPAVWSIVLPYEAGADELLGYRIELDKDGDTDTYEVQFGRAGYYLLEVEASFSSAPFEIPPNV